MLKKRLIFSLLYSEGYFLQSRNFNLQKVGNIDWLKNNYNFKNISPYIDGSMQKSKFESSNF